VLKFHTSYFALITIWPSLSMWLFKNPPTPTHPPPHTHTNTHTHTHTSNTRTRFVFGSTPFQCRLVTSVVLRFSIFFLSCVSQIPELKVATSTVFFQLRRWMEVQTYESEYHNSKIYVLSVHVVGLHKFNYVKNNKNQFQTTSQFTEYDSLFVFKKTSFWI
jgi:hypothetical protein